MSTAALPQVQQRQVDRCAIALRAFFRIIALWRLDDRAARVLLGQPGRATYYKWKRGDVGSLSHDTLCRVSYVLGIYKALQVLFQSPQQADDWIAKPNRVFGGQSARDRMLGGDITDLAAVRRYLDAVRGGTP